MSRVSFLGEGTPKKDFTHRAIMNRYPRLMLSAYCNLIPCFSLLKFIPSGPTTGGKSPLPAQAVDLAAKNRFSKKIDHKILIKNPNTYFQM